MLFFAAVKSLLDEVRLVELLSASLQVALQQLHCFLAAQLQAFFGQSSQAGLPDCFPPHCCHSFHQQSLGDWRHWQLFEHLPRHVPQSFIVKTLKEKPQFAEESNFEVGVVAAVIVGDEKRNCEADPVPVLREERDEVLPRGSDGQNLAELPHKLLEIAISQLRRSLH